MCIQLVRASEWNSVVVHSNPTQSNFLWVLLINVQGRIPYIVVHSVILINKILIKQMWQLIKAIAKMKSDSEQKCEIELAVQSCLRERVELMA